jgi:cadmium resistance protein CadD (predicted permease)
VDLALLGQAVGMFAVTNVDDLVVLAVFFGRGGGRRVVAGQYLGFAGILVVSVLGALGAGLLPERVIPFLGLVPLALGVRAGRRVWRDRRAGGGENDEPRGEVPGVLSVAAVTFANGGDNIGVYVPVFTVAGAGGMPVYVVVFLAGVAVWCAAGWLLATRPPVARVLSRWGHVVLPVVLVLIGVAILTLS